MSYPFTHEVHVVDLKVASSDVFTHVIYMRRRTSKGGHEETVGVILHTTFLTLAASLSGL